MTDTNSVSTTIISQVKPLVEYLRKQRENEKFSKSVENIATITLIVFFLIFAVRPTILTISALVGDIKSKEVLQKQMRLKINNIIQAQDTFSQVQERYSVINSSLPDSPQYANIAYQIQALGQSTGCYLDQINFDIRSSKSSGSLSSYNIKLGGPLDFPAILSFLEQLSQFRRLLHVNSLSFSASPVDIGQPESSSSASQLVNFSLSSDIFYWQNDHSQKK